MLPASDLIAATEDGPTGCQEQLSSNGQVFIGLGVIPGSPAKEATATPRTLCEMPPASKLEWNEDRDQHKLMADRNYSVDGHPVEHHDE